MELGIKTFIAANTSPELYDLLESIDVLVAKFGIEDHDEHILELIMTHQSRVAGDTIDIIVKVYSDMLSNFFDQHGITLTEDIDLYNQYKLALGVYYLQDYSDKNTVRNIIDSAISKEEAFADIFALVTDEVAENILNFVTDVNPNFLTAVLKALPDDEVLYDANQLPELTRMQLLVNFSNFKTFAMDQDLIIVQALGTGMTVGYSFDIYSSLIMHNVAILNPVKIAYELYLASLISSDQYNNVLMNVRDFTSKNFMEVETASKILIAASDIAVRYEKYILAKGNPNGQN